MRTRSFALVAVGAVVPLLLTLTGPSTSPAAGADADAGDDTSVTVQGSGRFSDLRVTVSKTEHLVNEVIHLTWSGMKGGSGNTFGGNYLQIMQCWGDEAVPDRRKCQFGGFIDLKYGGLFVAGRQVDYGTLVDPEETIKVKPGALHAYVPFHAVNGVVEEQLPSQFFGGYTTNEQPFGRTAGDGTGEDYFEVQTAREAPGLGCGDRVGSGARDCWLVIVPRDDREVDGAAPADGFLDSSPLSASNWKNKLSVRLRFDPVSVSCPIGTAEKRLLGHEELAEAITRWQPKLCGETGSIFGFSQVSDDIARAKALDVNDPWLNFVSHPIEPSRVPEGQVVTYAPVAISALGIVFNFDTNPAFRAPPEVEARRGQRINQLKLNQRLIAKLLTQSYQNGSFSNVVPPANPLDLLRDPEFKQLNPQFANLKTETPVVSLTQIVGLADGNEEFWAYVASDKDAVNFINGQADPWGMKVNPRYLKLDTHRADFPRQDLGTLDAGDNSLGGRILIQELDARPFAADMHDVARSTARGDTLSRTSWDPNSTPPAFKRDPLQTIGQRQLMGIADVPTARRYSLPMVALKNAAGNYVTPTEDSIRAGLVDMEESDVEGVLISNPKASAANAYPIPVVSYAVTSPQLLKKDKAKAYAALIRYAVTKGQQQGIEQGKLPVGYVPLTKQMVGQALKASEFIKRQGDKQPESTDPEEPDGTDGSGTSGELPSGDIPVPPPGAIPSDTPQAQDPVTTSPVTVSFRTPSDAPGPQRFILLATLVLGVLAAAIRPVLMLVERRRVALKTAGGSP